jgi:hypothetical protein
MLKDVRMSSLKQPYAELTASGRKTLELRKWNTKFRGQFLIHASMTTNNIACKLYNIDKSSLITGAIVTLLCFMTSRYIKTRESFSMTKTNTLQFQPIPSLCMDSCFLMGN